MDYRRLIRANLVAQKFFIQNFRTNKNARRRVYTRISKKVASRFLVGYAPRDGLIDFLNENDVSESVARTVGLIWATETGNAREVFTNRIILPIIHAGVMVGFGGRVLGKSSAAKYINSKSSSVYNKSNVLFGLWFTRACIRNAGFGIITEGYFDFLSLVDAGIKNVVSVCGVALTESHVRNLKRYTENICILTDGDKAGRTAAEKMEQILNASGVQAYIATLPNGLDPEDFLRKYGKKRLVKLIQSQME